jgi:predicted DNA-binding protein
MELSSKQQPTPKSISVFVRITPEMNEQLKELAQRVGGDSGVATMMRDIVENALAEGIDVVGGGGKRRRVRANGKPAAPEAT